MTPSIYVGTYAKYVSGSLFGEWLNLADYETYEGFVHACKELHKDESDPEFMVQDFDDFPCRSMYHEAGLPTRDEFLLLNEFAKLDDHDQRIVENYAEYTGQLLIEDALDRFLGEYEDGEYAEQLMEECENIPDWVKFYIDFQKMERDMEYNGEIIEYDGFYYSAN